ncbi:hypothetical protein [Methylacidiphilum caldifontis]|nr:hypothetical protein [Methylacidiphilum caldifontis]
MKRLIILFHLFLFLLDFVSQSMAKELWIDYMPRKTHHGQGGAFYIDPKMKFKIYVYGSPLKYLPLGVIVHEGTLTDAFRSSNGILRDMVAVAKLHHADALMIIEKNKPLIFAVAGFWPAFALPTGGGSFTALAVKECSSSNQKFFSRINRGPKK